MNMSNREQTYTAIEGFRTNSDRLDSEEDTSTPPKKTSEQLEAKKKQLRQLKEKNESGRIYSVKDQTWIRKLSAQVLELKDTNKALLEQVNQMEGLKENIRTQFFPRGKKLFTRRMMK